MDSRLGRRERQEPSHTARLCSVWHRMSTTSGLVPTNSILLAARNLVVSWKIGFRLNVS